MHPLPVHTLPPSSLIHLPLTLQTHCNKRQNPHHQPYRPALQLTTFARATLTASAFEKTIQENFSHTSQHPSRDSHPPTLLNIPPLPLPPFQQLTSHPITPSPPHAPTTSHFSYHIPTSGTRCGRRPMTASKKSSQEDDVEIEMQKQYLKKVHKQPKGRKSINLEGRERRLMPADC